MGKDAKKGTHINFLGGFFCQKGVPNGPFSATTSLVYCFLLALYTMENGPRAKDEEKLGERKSKVASLEKGVRMAEKTDKWKVRPMV